MLFVYIRNILEFEMELNHIETTLENVAALQVLVFGKHEYIVSNVKVQLEKADFKCTGSVVLSQALDHIKANRPNLVVIGGGVEPHERMKITNLITAEGLSTKVVEHFGGPATVLAEVRTAVASL